MRSVLFVFLIACGGGNKSPQPPVADKTPPASGSPSQGQPMVAANDSQPTCAEANVACAIDTLAYFSKQMCSCKDKTCADGVNNGMTKWGQDMAQKPSANTKPTEAEQKRIMEVVTKYTDCMTKVMMDGGQMPPPVDPSDPCGGGDPCGG